MTGIIKMRRLVVLLVLFVAYEYGNTTNAITLKDALQNAYLYSETVGIKEHMKDFGTINLEEAIVGFVPTLTLSWDYNKVFKRDTGTMANSNSGSDTQNQNPLMADLGNLKTMERANLKAFRVSVKKSQNEMANLLDITLSFYSKLELGLKNPSLKTIKKFKEVFPNANVDNIFLS